MQRRVLARSFRWSLRAAPAHGDLAQLDPRGGRGGQAYARWTNRARGIARLRHRRKKRTAVYWTGISGATQAFGWWNACGAGFSFDGDNACELHATPARGVPRAIAQRIAKRDGRRDFYPRADSRKGAKPRTILEI